MFGDEHDNPEVMREFLTQVEKQLYYSRGLTHFNINLLSDAYFRSLTRFTKEQFNEFYPLLRLPEEIRTPNRYVKHSSSAVCMLLTRLGHTFRYGDMAKIFKVSESNLCEICNTTATLLPGRLKKKKQKFKGLVWVYSHF